MLPYLPGIKTTLFTCTIKIIYESIVPLGSLEKTNRTQINNNKKVLGFWWHETIQGHHDEDVAGLVIKFLREPCYWDCKKMTIWCGKCSGQNKNCSPHFQIQN